MKKIIIILLTMVVGVNLYSQDNITIPERDTTYLFIGDSIDVVVDDVKEIGHLLKQDYDNLGFVGFMRTYKYIIITILILGFLWILSARGKNNEE
jgi:hypothetical protein